MYGPNCSYRLREALMTDNLTNRAVANMQIIVQMLLFVLVILGLTGCANSSKNIDAMNSLLLSESEPISQRSQLVIARYTHIIYQAPLSDEEKAELVYQRGVAYDAVGLNTLAMLDYKEAIRLKPDLAAAYNSMGVHYIQQREFIQATNKGRGLPSCLISSLICCTVKYT